MIKPQSLKKGDIVAILAPSSGAAEAFPHTYERGLEILKELGLRIKEYPTTRATSTYLSEHPEERARDFNDAIRDPDVKAILTSIGGEDSIRILEYLDMDAVKKNPKIIMGYSDSTSFLVAIHAQGIITHYGPSVMSGFAQARNLEKAYLEHVKIMLFKHPDNYMYPVYAEYSEGYPDWSDKETAGEVLPLKKNPGPRWLQGKRVQGTLWGGCREVLSMLNGTQWWPETDFFEGKILFMETSEEVPPISETKWLLRSLVSQGVIEKVSGILFGRSAGYTDEMKQELDETLVQIAKEAGREDLSIMTGVDFGHTKPQIILPLGGTVEMSENRIVLIE